MGKGYDWEQSETGNWNINLDYTRIEIMKHIAEASQLEELAEFGTSNVFEDITIHKEDKSNIRLLSLKRFAKKIQTIIKRTKFALRKKDKPLFEENLKNVEKIYTNYIPKCHKTINKIHTSSVGINEDLFTEVLNQLSKIFESLLEPLNRADIIFSETEQSEPEERKKQMIYKLSTQA